MYKKVYLHLGTTEIEWIKYKDLKIIVFNLDYINYQDSTFRKVL